MDTQDLSFNSFFSTNKKNYDEFIEVSNNFAFENYNFDISFIENNKLFEKEINIKLFEKDINNNLDNDDSCTTNHLFYNNNINSKGNGQKETQIKFISKIENLDKNSYNNNKLIYRKDAYYKHFKSIFSRYLKDKANKMKNICFPHFNKNNFFPLSYKYTGNPKEADNRKFLFFKIKDILIYGKDEHIRNRQYNNELLIRYIEKNERLTQNKEVYFDLINFLNNSVECELILFYNNKSEYENLKNDVKCQYFDKYFLSETGISLLERNGLIRILRKNK